MNYLLKSPSESIPLLADVLSNGNGSARLEVREDKCFQGDSWLAVGTVTLQPSADEGGDGESVVNQALRFGAYSWSVPTFNQLTESIAAAYPQKNYNAKQKLGHDDKTRRALEAVVHSSTRCGLVHPIFDAGSVADMPFSRPTTVVVDTCAVLQGGLDFVVRFLYPMARIKIPAIAHMEILNMTERYFSQRRAADGDFSVASALLDHVTSQGGQRVLLRLELQTEAEIERPRLGADPLLGIVHSDTDSEHKSLGLQVVQKSYADRLILETAIQHRDRLSPDHPIVVLTADQGLARMTLAEGLATLFFSSPPIEHVCGATLTGTCFRPFIHDGSDSPYYYIPLPSLLWELACTFGSARIVCPDQSRSFTISAIGDGLTWHPYHSRDDLLWTCYQSESGTPLDSSSGPARFERQEDLSEAQASSTDASTSASVASRATLRGAYRFSPSALVELVQAFARRERMPDKVGMQHVGLATAKRYSDLRNFLLAGDFATKNSEGLVKTGLLDQLAEAMRTADVDTLKQFFLRVPSFRAFVEELRLGHPLPHEAVQSISQSAIVTYIALSEIACAAMEISGEGIYPTPHSPAPSEFARQALQSYNTLRRGEEYVLTGKWLEELVRRFGIHPIKARDRLNEAREAGLIERYTEGSTPETQFERHKVAVLESLKNRPSVRSLNLYHGDFLIPGKASVSLRLEERRK
jgi:hypothetical protein